jgi:hypothetical protein
MLAQLPELVRQWIYQNNAFASRTLVPMSSDVARQLVPQMYVRSDQLPRVDPNQVVQFVSE